MDSKKAMPFIRLVPSAKLLQVLKEKSTWLAANKMKRRAALIEPS